MRSSLFGCTSRGACLKGVASIALIALSLILTMGSCKNDSTSEALKKEQKQADSLMKVAAENRKRLETEEELAERIRRLKNKGFITNDSVYFAARVMVRPDSLLSVITLNGKANSSGKINSFDHTAIALDGQIAKGIMNGTFFRSDRLAHKKYLLYSFEEDSGKVHAYLLQPSGDAMELIPAVPRGNYLYDLLKERTFEYTLDNKERFFKTLRSAEITDDPFLDSLFNKARIYRDPNNLLPETLSAPFARLWLDGEHGSSNVLLIHPADSLPGSVTLSGRYVNPKTVINISSRFLNDSIWQQATVKESLVYDHPHLVVYQTDSVSRTFGYTEDFYFKLIGIDTVQRKQNYPQYYPTLKDSVFEIRSDAFGMNGKKAYWRYMVRYTPGSEKSEVAVRVINRDLVNAGNDKLIFRLPAAGTPSTAKLSELLTPENLFEGRDLNFDGFADLSFRKGTDLNNNPIYIVYLYEPASGRFRRTPELDGRSVRKEIIRDTIHRKLIYTGFIDGGHMSVSLTDPTPGNENIKEIYWTTGNRNAPQVHYQKMVNHSITDKQSPVLEQLPLDGNDLPTALINWILSR